jgi:hypothetical protein
MVLKRRLRSVSLCLTRRLIKQRHAYSVRMRVVSVVAV